MFRLLIYSVFFSFLENVCVCVFPLLIQKTESYPFVSKTEKTPNIIKLLFHIISQQILHPLIFFMTLCTLLSNWLTVTIIKQQSIDK